jgi:4-hydroxy-2-oxoheptanedioate aldolase
MNGRQLREALRAGRRVYGTLIVSPSPHWPPAVARLGLDFVFLDTEHVPLDRARLSWMCRAYAARGLAPVVRITHGDPHEAARVLDGGAEGVIVPYVESAEQVRKLRGAVKFRPLKGGRLRAFLSGQDPLPDPTRRYLERCNARTVLIVNIESGPAMEALDEILGVEGLDAVLVGPHDLSVSLGLPEQYAHPVFVEAVDEIIRKARRAGVGAGIHAIWPGCLEPETRWAKLGANLIVHGGDLQAMQQKLSADLDAIRTALGETARGGAGGADV